MKSNRKGNRGKEHQVQGGKGDEGWHYCFCVGHALLEGEEGVECERARALQIHRLFCIRCRSGAGAGAGASASTDGRLRKAEESVLQRHKAMNK